MVCSETPWFICVCFFGVATVVGLIISLSLDGGWMQQSVAIESADIDRKDAQFMTLNLYSSWMDEIGNHQKLTAVRALVPISILLVLVVVILSGVAFRVKKSTAAKHVSRYRSLMIAGAVCIGLSIATLFAGVQIWGTALKNDGAVWAEKQQQAIQNSDVKSTVYFDCTTKNGNIAGSVGLLGAVIVAIFVGMQYRTGTQSRVALSLL